MSVLLSGSRNSRFLLPRLWLPFVMASIAVTMAELESILDKKNQNLLDGVHAKFQAMFDSRIAMLSDAFTGKVREL